MISKPRAASAKRKKKTAPRTASKPVRKAASKPAAKTRSAAKAKPKASAATKTRAAAKTSAAPKASAVPSRRAVFIDVENTSSEAELMRVYDELKVDIKNGATQVAAIGNWRMVAQQLGRSLAQRGAQLVHSAPAPRVSDWSDLWIAVQAGMWLGRARPGDEINIISHDRAFDAVGDAAAQLGVVFRRITYRSAGASAVVDEGHSDAERVGAGRGRRRRRGGGRSLSGGGAAVSQTTHHARTPRAHAAAIAGPAPTARGASVHDDQASAPLSDESRHGASPQELHAIIARLVAGSASRTVTLDALTVALKAAGFQRPPGSPRLVTRLRQVKGLDILPNGKLQLRDDDATPAQPSDAPVDEASLQPSGTEQTGMEPDRERRPRRRGRRGGRGRTSAAST